MTTKKQEKVVFKFINMIIDNKINYDNINFKNIDIIAGDIYDIIDKAQLQHTGATYNYIRNRIENNIYNIGSTYDSYLSDSNKIIKSIIKSYIKDVPYFLNHNDMPERIEIIYKAIVKDDRLSFYIASNIKSEQDIRNKIERQIKKHINKVWFQKSL